MTLRLRDHDLEWSEINGEIVVLDTIESVYVSFRHAGALLWRLLAQAAPRERLVEALMRSYDLDAWTAAADVDGFVAELEEHGLLVSGPASGRVSVTVGGAGAVDQAAIRSGSDGPVVTTSRFRTAEDPASGRVAAAVALDHDPR